MRVDVDTIQHMILQDGLRNYKFKNSKTKPAGTSEPGRKGAIFAWRSKQKMEAGVGVVLTSEEALHSTKEEYTHWTPNVFRYGTYTSQGRHLTKGHSEDNLRQINTFVVDIDAQMRGRPLTVSDILLEAIQFEFMPTLILRTTRGFQMYFVLEKPAYVTSHSNFKVIKVAKRISEWVRQSFAKTLPVDLTCNHFGIARIPRKDNVEFFDPNYRYPFAKWLHWSIKAADGTFNRKPSFAVLQGSNGKRQIDEPWFDLLLHKSSIKGQQGVYGRNTAIFTLALAYYSSGVSQETCEFNIQQFNGFLKEPLREEEMYKSINSAYSGRYAAANHDYILPLCQEWVSKDLTAKDLFVRQGWFKFRKPRIARVRSHLDEWRDDLKQYLSQKTTTDQPYMATSCKQISADVGIPARSLAKLLKRMCAAGELVLQTRRGRNGGTTMALTKMLLVAGMKAKQASVESFRAFVDGLKSRIGLFAQQVVNRLQAAVVPQEFVEEVDLFERDTG